jgi:hypothetical protein
LDHLTKRVWQSIDQHVNCEVPAAPEGQRLARLEIYMETLKGAVHAALGHGSVQYSKGFLAFVRRIMAIKLVMHEVELESGDCQ